MSMENPNPEYRKQLEEGHFAPQEGENVEKIKKGDQTLQMSRLKEKLGRIIKKLKRETGENLEDVEVIEDDKA